VADPYIPAGEAPTVEQVVPLVVIAPLDGIAIVPVTPPVGAGLTPRELISVESIGIPAGPTDPLELTPSGVVSCSGGVAVVGSSTCAKAGLTINNEATATINDDRT
jgi:hypothetical protein